MSALSINRYSSPSNSKQGKDKLSREDLAKKTEHFIKTRKYHLSRELLLKPAFSSSLVIDSILKNAKHESRFDTYNEKTKKWTFTYCGTTSEGNPVRMIVSPGDLYVNIINVVPLKVGAQKKEQYDDEYRKIINLIDKNRINFTTHVSKYWKNVV